MPAFDGLATLATSEQFAAASGRERLAFLAEALKRQMPQGFTWDFGTIYEKGHSCGTAGCALGLAKMLWPQIVRNPEYDEQMCKVFRIDDKTLYRLFYTPQTHVFFHVSPFDVAKSIEKYLAGAL